MRFDDLREALLKGGVAPRHVRRYLTELNEHLEDLTARQREAGFDGQDATLRARALLGTDKELATAMLEQKQFRSLAARAPWAVFLLLPPFAAIAIGTVFIGSLVGLGEYYDFPDMHAPPPPQWFQTLAIDIVATANLTVMPLTAALFVTLAARQRLKLIWPFVATALLLILFIHSDVSFPPRDTGNLSIGAAPIFMADGWKMMSEHWQLVIVQYVLTLLPFSILYRKLNRKRTQRI